MSEPQNNGWRCDEMLVSLVLRQYDANGLPMNEQVLNVKNQDGAMSALKLYRAQAPDVWSVVDSTVEKFLNGGK